MKQQLCALALLSFSALGIGCSNGDASESSADDAGAGGGGAAGQTSSCPAPGFPSNEPPHVVSQIAGKVVALDGVPLAGTLALLCGVDICIYGSTDDQGNIVTCDDSEPPVCTPGIGSEQAIRRPAFKYGDGLSSVRFAYLLPTDRASYELGSIKTALLPPLAEGSALTAGSEVTSSGVTLTLPAGGSIEIDKLSYASDEEQRFRAVSIPVVDPPAPVDPALGFEIVVGMTPVDTRFCPEATLSVPNSVAWPADTAVEFWLHGVEPGQEWAPYAGWAKVSEGRVSSDGARVVTAEGDGIPALSVIGVRKK